MATFMMAVVLVSIVALAIFVRVRWELGRRRRAHAWVIAGEAIGLRWLRQQLPLVGEQVCLVGEHEEVALHVTRHAGSEDSYVFVAQFETSLELGLLITADPSDWTFIGRKLEPAPLRGMHAFAAEQKAAHRLLRRVKTAIERANRGYDGLQVTDESVTLVCHGAEAEQFVQTAQAVVSLSRKIGAARSKMRTPRWIRRAQQHWEERAAAIGLSIADDARAVSGRYRGVDIEAKLQSGAQRGVAVRAAWTGAPSIASAFTLVPRRDEAPSETLLSLVGLRSFDLEGPVGARFRSVAANPPELSPRVSDALLALADVRSVRAEHDGVRVELDPAHAGDLDHCLTLAVGLIRAFEESERDGPYRA